MVSKFYGREYSLSFLRENCYITKDGVTLTSIAQAAEVLGFNTLMSQLTTEDLVNNAPLPAILHWNSEHFIVLYDIKRNRAGEVNSFTIADPAVGLVSVNRESFNSSWLSNSQKNKGIALILEPTEEFYTKASSDNKQPPSRASFRFIIKYFFKYKKYFGQLLLAMFCATIISLFFPFLTQSIIDIGIESGDLNFVFLILIFQLFLFLSTTVIEFIQSQLLLHIGTRINVSIISDFLSKLMRLPIRFFDSKNVGDIINRINDQKRIEAFITSTVLRTTFGLINFVVFMIVLAIYNIPILLVFLAGSTATFGWTMLFMKRRRNLDYKLFNSITANNENIYELVNGMQEIKLNNLELYKKWQWQKHQAGLFSLNISNLKLEQYQAIGSVFFTQLKNILITFIAATAVIRGDITLGMMLSISFITGQLNAPIEQFISFFKVYQHAKISSERMQEIYNEPDEELSDAKVIKPENIDNGHSKIVWLISDQTSVIKIKNLCFSYGNPKDGSVLNNINITIPKGSITAIVGASGSGKSTLIKLLLKFYEPSQGEIFLNGSNLSGISAKWWRQKCGIVMQDGYLFADTIEKNIITSLDVDEMWLKQVCKIVCLDQYLAEHPQGLQTKIGSSGIGLSGGEKQRILIARAIYKKPEFLFFDEAISSLDANNERIITENLYKIYHDKTVVIVAHRLSTVKHADQIIVLNKGSVVEHGSHKSLVAGRGAYFELVKNQLELDS